MRPDEFLKHQQESGIEIMATVEPVPDKVDRVKVTPYSRGRGCRCSSGFQLAVADIEDVQPLGNAIWCCGKQLRPAKVIIRRGASLPIDEALALMRGSGGGSTPCKEACNRQYERCKARHGTDCEELSAECLADCEDTAD